MDTDFVSEEIARLAKKAKFNEPCLMFYNDGKFCQTSNLKYTQLNFSFNSQFALNDDTVCAPTQTALAKWFRDEFNIHVTPELTSCDKNGKGVYSCKIIFPDKNGTVLSIGSKISHAYKSKPSDKFCKEIGSYEEALELGLKVALETLLNIMHYQDVEHKIGEIFKYDGKIIKVEKCDGRYDCDGCIHSKTDGGCRMYDEAEKFEDFEECTSEYRKDKEDVKFIEIIEE